MLRALLFCLFATSLPLAAADIDELRAELGALAAAEIANDEDLAVSGQDGWLFLESELRHLAAGPFWGEQATAVSQASNPDYADPLAAILDVQNQLAARDIQLVLVPIPPKAAIYPDRLPEAVAAAADTDLVPHYQDLYQRLREAGVAVVDAAPALRAARAADAELGPVYARTDTHYSGRGMAVIADLIAERVHLAEPAEPLTLQAHPETVTIAGDLVGPEPPGEPLLLAVVTDAAGDFVAPDEASPVLLLGDSHALVYHSGADLHARGAGLPDHLALRLGRAVDLLGVRGSGATAARISLFRRSRADPTYLDGKRAVIWVFTARDFTESSGGWRPLPVAP